MKCPIKELSIELRSDKVHSANCGPNCPLYVGEDGGCALPAIARGLKELVNIINTGITRGSKHSRVSDV